MQFGSDDLAKYTFLPEAGDFIRAQGIELSDLAKPDYGSVVERAKERVLQAIKGGKISVAQIESQREAEIMSFPISLLLVRATNLDHLMKIYAAAEARRVEYFLSREANPRIIEDIFREFLALDLEHTGGKVSPSSHLPKFRIALAEYAKRASSIRKEEWKLVNRILENGKVFLTQEDLIRLISEEIKALILQRLRSIKVGKLPQNLQDVSNEIAKLAPPPPRSEFSTLNIGPENYPPCVREALRLLEKGENVPHYGRFLMATYLLRVGKSVEDIVALFPKSPDFKQNVTRYQVEHIAGLKGGRTRYSVPSCSTLQTHSFCFMDPVKCYGIASPLQYPSKTRPVEKKGSVKSYAKTTADEGTKRKRTEWTKPQR
jgi:DNA primase large subunit